MPLPAETVIAAEGLSVAPDGIRLAVRLPWYRSLPLSTVVIEALSIDGTDVPLDVLRFELDDGSWTLAELADATDRLWFVLDSAHLKMPAGVDLDPARDHVVDLTITIFPPYIPGLRRANRQAETLRLAA